MTLSPDRSQLLQPKHTISAARTIVTDPLSLPFGITSLAVQSVFLYGSSGTDVTVYTQTSLDGGTTWLDIVNHHFTTSAATKISQVRQAIALAAAVSPGDGTLTDDTILDGLLGDQIRVKFVSTGTYAGTTNITVNVVAN